MNQPVDFYYDIVSPYSYLAAKQVAELEAATGAAVTWKPLFLGGLFKQLGNSAPLSLEAKKRYMFHEDLPRLAAYLNVDYVYPAVFPTNTLLVQRLLAALPAQQRPAISLALYKLYWGQGLDVAEPEVVSRVLSEEQQALGHDEAAKSALKALTDEAIARGAFGAPTFIWQDRLYFGCDRMHLLKADLLATG